MWCAICGKTSEEVDLEEGIYQGRISKVCKHCANMESIPLIKKPTEEMFMQINQRPSVRERMERLTNTNRRPAREQIVTNESLARLRLPGKKQENEEVVENYDWNLRMARRRMKFTTLHVAEKTGIPDGIINDLERGILPKDYERIMRVLEREMGIQLLKKPYVAPQPAVDKQEEEKNQNAEKKKPGFFSTLFGFGDDEDEEQARPADIIQKRELDEDKRQRLDRLMDGELKFSDRDNLKDLTLNDLLELKKQKEKRQQEILLKKQTEEMFGEDIKIVNEPEKLDLDD